MLSHGSVALTTLSVQGMGAHMDIALPGHPPGGGTYEGAYDNTAGTVSMMMYARAFVD